MIMSESRLQSELKKRRPFETVEEEVVLNILRAADQLGIQFDRLFRQFGLTSSQYNVLRILRGEGAPLPITEIGARTVAVVPGITGIIDRLEQAGHARRVRSLEDRRVIHVEITPEAISLLEKIDGPLKALHQSLLRGLEDAEKRTINRLMERLREGMGQAHPSNG